MDIPTDLFGGPSHQRHRVKEMAQLPMPPCLTPFLVDSILVLCLERCKDTGALGQSRESTEQYKEWCSTEGNRVSKHKRQ